MSRIGLLPADWGIVQLSDVADVRLSGIDKHSSEDEKPVLLCNYLDVYKSDCIRQDMRFMRATARPDEISKLLLAPDDVVITKDSETWDDIAIPAYVEGVCHNLVCGYHLALITTDKKRMHGRFLFSCFQSKEWRRQFEQLAVGATRYGISKETIQSAQFPLPTLPEQHKIAEILGSVDENIEKTQALVAKLQDLKKATMQELLTKGIGRTKFKDSPVGRIPENWTVRSLQQITTKIVDGVHSTPKYIDNGIPFLTVENLTASNGISLHKVRYVSAQDHAVFIRRADPRIGDVLVSKDGTLGVARVVPDWFPEFSIFVSVAMLRPDTEQVLPELICAFFDTGEYARQLAYLSAGTGLKHIHLEHFRAFQLAVPPKKEQRELFDILNSMDKQIDTRSAYLMRLQNLKKALMQDLLTGKVRVKI